jgi:probable HAF family extracellular repeat protein
MKTQTSKTFKLAIAAAALLTPILAGADLPHKIWRSGRVGQPAADTAASSQYRFVTFDGAPGALVTEAYGVNNSGLVSGFYLDAAGNWHGLLWQNGVLRIVDYPGAPVTFFGGVNDVGLVILNHGDVTTQHAATYNTHRATWTTLPDISGYPLNFGNGINNSGVGLGAACTGNINAVASNCVGWTWDEGVYSFFTAPEADQALGGTYSNGINNRGQVVGYFEDASLVTHGFLKNGDTFATIDVPAASSTYALNINDSDEIAGYYLEAGNYHGFVRGRDGQFTTVNVPGAVWTGIEANDDRGDLAGQFLDSSGVTHGFVAFKKEPGSRSQRLLTVGLCLRTSPRS